MRLDSIKIKPRLIGAFLIVAVLCGIVGYKGISTMFLMNSSTQTIYNDRVVPLKQLKCIADSYAVNIVDTSHKIRNGNLSWAEGYRNVKQARETIDKEWQVYLSTYLVEEEKKLVKDMKPLKARADSSVDKLEDILRQRDAAALSRFTINELYPTIDPVSDKFSALVDVQLNVAKNEYDKSTKLFGSSKAMLWTIMIISVILAVSLGALISLSVANPVQQLSGAAEKLAVGDVDVSVNTSARDEIGDLSRSMQAMVANIRASAKAADRISAGDLTVEVEAKSDKDVLAKAMARVVDSLRSLAAEADMLSKAGVEGRLETRGDVEKFEGGYREIVRGVNDTLDAVIGPLNVAAEYVERMSIGDIPQKITDDYHGDFNEVKNNLNKCIDAVNELVADANLLSLAAIEGKLDTRADASKHQGDFRAIVQGVNDTLDSLVGHIDSVPAPAMIVDKEFTIQYMNDMAANVIGLTKNQLVGTKCYDHFKTSDCKTANCACGKAMQTNQAATSETDAHPGGKNLDIAYTGVPIKDRQGSVIGALEVVTDQTAIKRAARLSQKVAEFQDVEVSKLNEALGKFADRDLTVRNFVDDGDEDTAEVRAKFAQISDAFNQCVDAVSQAVVQVTESAGKVAASSQTLSASVEEVGTGAQQITETIQQVASGSQEQSKTVQASAAAMEQLGRSIGEVAQGAQTQAKVVDDTVVLVQQISTAIDQVAKSAQDAANTSQQVSEVATEGGQQVAEAVGSMDRIKEATDRVADMVKRLGESSQQIGAIVETIDDIAEQTNLLALNAAIEAARAGEHGKGFAVVADEVRKLAERSSKATGEIAELIGGIRQMTDHAVDAMEAGSKEVAEGTSLGNQAGQALQRIQEAVASVVRQAQDVSAAAVQMTSSSGEVISAIENVSAITEQSTASTEEMAAASGEVASQIEQVAAVSQENAAASEEVSSTAENQNAAVEEMTSAAEELSVMAEHLQELVGQFKVADGNVQDVTAQVSSRKRRKAA